MKYVRCPVCHLNYIMPHEQQCSVCANKTCSYDNDQELCPYCYKRAIRYDQIMCERCYCRLHKADNGCNLD